MATTACLKVSLAKTCASWRAESSRPESGKSLLVASLPGHKRAALRKGSFIQGQQVAAKSQQKARILAAIGPNAGTYDPSDPNAEPGQTALIVVDADGAESDTVPSDVELEEGSEVSKGPSKKSTADLKQQLMDTLYGTDRGLRASSETRAEITELINQLEAANPNEAPTDKLDILNGKWNLIYTGFSELVPLLAASNLPGIEVGEISQIIDTFSFTATNTIHYKGLLGSNSFSATAAIEIRSPKRLQIRFEEGSIGSLKPNEGFQVPRSVSVFGQQVDTGPLDILTKPLQELTAAIARIISGQPPLKFPIRGGSGSSSWLLTTYLDEDLRFARGDGGGLFVLLKEGSRLR